MEFSEQSSVNINRGVSSSKHPNTYLLSPIAFRLLAAFNSLAIETVRIAGLIMRINRSPMSALKVPWNRIIVPETNIPIAVGIVYLFAIDQCQLTDAKEGQLLNDVGPQTADADHSNTCLFQSRLTFFSKEPNIPVKSCRVHMRQFLERKGL